MNKYKLAIVVISLLSFVALCTTAILFASMKVILTTLSILSITTFIVLLTETIYRYKRGEL